MTPLPNFFRFCFPVSLFLLLPFLLPPAAIAQVSASPTQPAAQGGLPAQLNLGPEGIQRVMEKIQATERQPATSPAGQSAEPTATETPAAGQEGKASQDKHPAVSSAKTTGRRPKIANPSSLEAVYRTKYGASGAAHLGQFGYDIFAATAPPSQLTVPGDDYILGPGDSLRIRVWGSGLDAEFTGAISREGTINVPKIGIVPLTGARFGEAESIIRKEAEKYVQGINISVSLAQLRSIEIYVVGEVNRPGLRMTPPFSTVLNGLISAGGVRKSGSLRHIKLYRDNKLRREIDLYDLLLNGNRDADLLLTDRDLLFVPRIGRTAAVSGAVRQPGIYEINDGDSLADILGLAGNPMPQSFMGRIYLRRFQGNREFIVQDIDSQAQAVDYTAIPVQDGDLVEIQFLASQRPQVVSLTGHVWMPDVYSYHPGLKLSDILTSPDLLRPEAVTEHALLHRYQPETTEPIIEKFPLAQVFAGTFDLELRPFDRIEILSRQTFANNTHFRLKDGVWQPEYVELTGHVWKPEKLPFIPGMQASEVVTGIDLFKPEAITDFALLHRYDPKTTRYLPQKISLTAIFDGSNDPQLHPFDRIEILSRAAYHVSQPIRIAGAVWKPGEYEHTPRLTIADLLALAGGLKFGADPGRIDISRQTIAGETVSTDHLTINLATDPSFPLQPYDYVFIRQLKDAVAFKQVTIDGEVKFPGQYRIKNDERLADLIRRAGGYTPNAYLYGARFLSSAARTIQQQSLDQLINELEIRVEKTVADQVQTASSASGAESLVAGQTALRRLINRLRTIKATGRVAIQLADLETLADSPYNIVLDDGDRLIIPKRMEFVSVVGSVYTPNSYLFQPELTVADYLRMAGGPTRQADDDYIYVLKANGEVMAKSQQGLLGGRFAGQPLMPGDTVVVPEKLDRIPYLMLARDISDILFKIATTAGVALAL